MSQKKSRGRGGGGGAAASGDGHEDLARLADSFTLKFRPITLERPKVLDVLPASQIPHQHNLVTRARASRLL
jgi:translation initiation factor eIF-2B subunit epsilon